MTNTIEAEEAIKTQTKLRLTENKAARAVAVEAILVIKSWLRSPHHLLCERDIDVAHAMWILTTYRSYVTELLTEWHGIKQDGDKSHVVTKGGPRYFSPASISWANNYVHGVQVTEARKVLALAVSRLAESGV